MRTIEIVFVGGPNGGKTKGIPLVKEELEKVGYKVLVGKEIGTWLMEQGISPKAITQAKFQELVMEAQIGLENIMRKIAKCNEKDTVILYDRGIPEGEVFVNHEWYVQELKKHGLNEQEVLKRYYIVIDMVSTAIGLPELYTMKDNNKFRFHDKEQSELLERRSQKAYGQHPNFVVIDNSTNFEQKVHRAAMEIIRRIGKAK